MRLKTENARDRDSDKEINDEEKETKLKRYGRRKRSRGVKKIPNPVANNRHSLDRFYTFLLDCL